MVQLNSFLCHSVEHQLLVKVITKDINYLFIVTLHYMPYNHVSVMQYHREVELLDVMIHIYCTKEIIQTCGKGSMDK